MPSSQYDGFMQCNQCWLIATKKGLGSGPTWLHSSTAWAQFSGGMGDAYPTFSDVPHIFLFRFRHGLLKIRPDMSHFPACC